MVTDQQVRRLVGLMEKEKTKAVAASKAGMDRKTARRYLNSGNLPSQIKKTRDWRTRPDPFERDWDEVKDMLAVNPGLEAKTIFYYLQREHIDRYSEGQLRTLQRRIRRWRATEGPPKEVFFPQVHRPGELSESDFTHLTALEITIRGELLKHILYHFVLTYSNWETGKVCYSESFENLAAGYQEAVWELGGVTKKHRTDRMSSAVNKDCNPEKFTARYKTLLRHYGVEPERTNSASANENGDIEQRHYRFKNAVKQALILRGSRDFASVEEYERFLRRIFDQLNAGRQKRLKEELGVLGALPARRLDNHKPLEVTVGPSSTIRVQHNTYSVHSRLIGERVNVKLYVDYFDILYANKPVERIPRLRGESKHRIEYRHIIDWLKRKPGAFENYRYKTDMFPSSYFRIAYDNLRRYNPLRANKEYVTILYTAAKEGETVTESAIKHLISRDKPVSAEAVISGVKESVRLPSVTDIAIDDIDLAEYDGLLASGKEAGVYA